MRGLPLRSDDTHRCTVDEPEVVVMSNAGALFPWIRPDVRYTTLFGPTMVLSLSAPCTAIFLVASDGSGICQPLLQPPVFFDRVTFALRLTASLRACVIAR